MKLTFFLIAFCLVFLRVYLSWSGFDKKGKDNFTVTISTGDDYEQIKHGGTIVLTDNETGIKSMAPGAYLKYRKNDNRFIAESNLGGEISYTINDRDKIFTVSNDDKKLETEAISEMIAYGFDAPNRAERIYKKGGYTALIQEAAKIKNPGVASIYLKPLLEDDSLSQDNMVAVMQSIRSVGSDNDKMAFLKKLKVGWLSNPQVMQIYFDITGKLGSDMDKVGILKSFIDNDSVSVAAFDKVMNMAIRLGSDMDKKFIYNLMIDKGLVAGERFGMVLDAGSHFGSDMDKANIYRKLMTAKGITEEQWISIINKTEQLGSESDRSNLLVSIAAKMPKTENTKVAYLKVAKSIHADNERDKVMKAIE